VIEDMESHRTVALTTSYDGFDAATFIETHGKWHRVTAQLPARVSLDRFGLDAVENRYSGTISAWYSTTYRISEFSQAQARQAVEQRLAQSGNWEWIEPKKDVLFLSGPFDAEIHLHQEANDALVECVGEFSIATPGRASELHLP